MPTIYYMKDRPLPNSERGRKIDLNEILNKFRYANIKYLCESHPKFNEETPSQYPKYVVVKVEENETKNDIFNKVGYYFLTDVSPEDAEHKLFG